MAHDVVNGIALPVNAGSADTPSNSPAYYQGDMAAIISALRIFRNAIDSDGHIDATYVDGDLKISGDVDFTASTPAYSAYTEAGDGGRNSPFIKIG